jgi:hypothetical protein
VTTGADSGPRPVDVVASYLGSFAAADPDVIADHVTADFVNEHRSALGSSCHGREEYRRRLPQLQRHFTSSPTAIASPSPTRCWPCPRA